MKKPIAHKLSLPQILTANTYWWRPSLSASGRRSNEQRRTAEVEAFSSQVAELVPGTSISFTYTESCKIVYKGATYFVPEKGRTNLTGYIGYCKRQGLELVKC